MTNSNEPILVFEYFTASGKKDKCIISEAEALLFALIDDLKDYKLDVVVNDSYSDILSEYDNVNPIVIDDDILSWLEENASNFKKAPGVQSNSISSESSNKAKPAVLENANNQENNVQPQASAPSIVQSSDRSGLNNVQIRRVVPSSDLNQNEQNEKDNDKEYILLYMRDFRVSKNLSDITTCTMKFYVYSTLSKRISNISYRLKWPNMETPLSFDNVETNDVLYQTYTLLGDGCYDMDIEPNIIVNRCRVKDMPESACTAKIHWVQ